MFIFNFHHVEAHPKHASRKHLTVTPEGLGRIIDVLRWSGLTIVSLKQVLKRQAVEPGYAGAEHDALLTFDDGFENFYTEAVPVLEKKNCPGTVFVLAGRFSGNNAWDQGNLPEIKRDRLMSREQVADLGNKADLISVGSHGMLHQYFSYISDDELHKELHDSYTILKEVAGEAFVPVLAYPWGDFSDRVIWAMSKSPYKMGMTTEKGEWREDASPYAIPRYSAYHRDGNSMVFTAKLMRYRLGRFDFKKPVRRISTPISKTAKAELGSRLVRR